MIMTRMLVIVVLVRKSLVFTRYPEAFVRPIYVRQRSACIRPCAIFCWGRTLALNRKLAYSQVSSFNAVLRPLRPLL